VDRSVKIRADTSDLLVLVLIGVSSVERERKPDSVDIGTPALCACGDKGQASDDCRR
jgi:hypothetical protein